MRFEALLIGFPDGMRSWRAITGDFSFIITEETRTGPGFERYTGFTASWKNIRYDTSAFGQQRANQIDGGPWVGFVDAEKACRDTYHQLKARN